MNRAMVVTVRPMDAAAARAILAWRYPPPYSFYDFTGDEPIDDLIDPVTGYTAAYDAGGALVGYYSFGDDARVPGGVYADTALDVGAGMRPDLIGAGRGAAFVATGLAVGRERFAPAAFRATIAAFNHRARRACEALGFVATGELVGPGRHRFVILCTRDTRQG